MLDTVGNIFQVIILKMRAIYPEKEALAITNRLLEHFLDIAPTQRVLERDKVPDAEKTFLLNKAASRLLNHEPLQYVTGKAYFMDLEIAVNPSVLIPRPETEELVGLVIEEIRSGRFSKSIKILDIGTGSGCIALALKHYLPHCEVFAIDISAEAIQTALSNAGICGTEINFLEMDILHQASWDNLPEFDVIVSNPPYVTESEKKWMLPNVLRFEPHLALFVPDGDPLVFYKAIATFAKAKLKDNGSLWFETNERFGSLTREILINEGFTESNIFHDIHEKERFLHSRKKFST